MTQNVDERINRATNTQLPRVLVFEDVESWFRASIQQPFSHLADFHRFGTRASLERPEHFNNTWALYIGDIVIDGEVDRGDEIIHNAFRFRGVSFTRPVILTTGEDDVDLRAIEREHKKNGWHEFTHYIRKDEYFTRELEPAIKDLLRSGTSTERAVYHQDFLERGALENVITSGPLSNWRDFGVAETEKAGLLPGGEFTVENLFEVWEEIESDPDKNEKFSDLLEMIRKEIKDEYARLHREGDG